MDGTDNSAIDYRSVDALIPYWRWVETERKLQETPLLIKTPSG